MSITIWSFCEDGSTEVRDETRPRCALDEILRNDNSAILANAHESFNIMLGLHELSVQTQISMCDVDGTAISGLTYDPKRLDKKKQISPKTPKFHLGRRHTWAEYNRPSRAVRADKRRHRRPLSSRMVPIEMWGRESNRVPYRTSEQIIILHRKP